MVATRSERALRPAINLSTTWTPWRYAKDPRFRRRLSLALLASLFWSSKVAADHYPSTVNVPWSDDETETPPSTLTRFVYFDGAIPGRVAAFGGEVPSFDSINLMFPPKPDLNNPSDSTSTVGDGPDDKYTTPVNFDADGWLSMSLCEYPQSLDNLTRDDVLLRRNNQIDGTAIGLTVLWDRNCTVEDQARNAIRIGNDFSLNLRYLIVHGDIDDPEALQVLVPDRYPTPPFLQKISVVHVSYFTAKYFILPRFNSTVRETGNSPFLMDPSGYNRFWSSLVTIEPGLYDSDYPGAGSPRRGRSDSFYFFRILLFALLIMAPCARALYLWWSGGGRILFRRNENGRIVGLQYVS